MNEHCSIFNLSSITLILLLLTGSVTAQNKLDLYIQEGITNNKSIQQQEFIYQQSLYALKEAKSLFLPTALIGGNYTNARGGRSISIPIGDLLNPAYESLNQLTNSQSFPQLDNMNQQLNPSNFYDAKLRLSMPIFNSEILYNQKIKKGIQYMQQVEIMLFKRELVKDIKIAYYQYCQATQAIQVWQNGLILAHENLRINRSLYQNGKANHTSVLRAESELKEVEKSIFTAEQTQKNSTAYFNFLLNKALDSAIEIEEIQLLEETSLEYDENINNREEIKKLQLALDISQTNKKMQQSYFMPKVGAFIDLGLQNENWKFNHNSKYYMFGVSVEWTFSLGGGDQQRVKQAQASVNATKSQFDYAKQQIEMQLYSTNNSYKEALNNYTVMKEQLITIEKYYTDVLKQYKEGQALYIELLEAQNKYVNTQLELNLALYDVYIKQAQKERASASFNL